MLVLVGRWPVWNSSVIIVIIMYFGLLSLLGPNIVPHLRKSVFAIVIIINIAAPRFGT